MKKHIVEKKPAEKCPPSPTTRNTIPKGLRKAMARVRQEADAEGAAR